MAEPASSFRIQPCLLDRLIDEAPGEKLESRLQRVMSLATYRDCVRRDVSDLLNTHARLSPAEAAEFPRAAESVLNFGLRDLCGVSSSALEWSDFERHLAQTLRTFEPRLVPHTVHVKASATNGGRECPTRIGFEVRADLWARPVPEAWLMKTEIDLESGTAVVTP